MPVGTDRTARGRLRLRLLLLPLVLLDVVLVPARDHGGEQVADAVAHRGEVEVAEQERDERGRAQVVDRREPPDSRKTEDLVREHPRVEEHDAGQQEQREDDVHDARVRDLLQRVELPLLRCVVGVRFPAKDPDQVEARLLHQAGDSVLRAGQVLPLVARDGVGDEVADPQQHEQRAREVVDVVRRLEREDRVLPPAEVHAQAGHGEEDHQHGVRPVPKAHARQVEVGLLHHVRRLRLPAADQDAQRPVHERADHGQGEECEDHRVDGAVADGAGQVRLLEDERIRDPAAAVVLADVLLDQRRARAVAGLAGARRLLLRQDLVVVLPLDRRVADDAAHARVLVEARQPGVRRRRGLLAVLRRHAEVRIPVAVETRPVVALDMLRARLRRLLAARRVRIVAADAPERARQAPGVHALPVLLDPLLEVVAVALEAIGWAAFPDPVRDDVESLVVEDGRLTLLDPEIDVALEAVFGLGVDGSDARQQECERPHARDSTRGYLS
jgi:hypothetical protein